MTWLFSLIDPTWLVGGLFGLIGILGAYFKGSVSGARKERLKQAEQEIEARNEAQKIENEVEAMPIDKKREELLKWGKR